MILIKLGGSLIAPKDKPGYIDTEYLEKFSHAMQGKNIILIHGTGNVGHGFIKKYGLSEQTFLIGRKTLDNYYKHIDTYFKGYERIRYREETNWKNIKQKTIIGGDITENLEIISSDSIFAKILAQNSINLAIIATDVDGVLDNNGNIIPTISTANIHSINFRQKPGDVNGSMKQKIQHLIEHNNGSGKIVWICNGYNLENINHIITTEIGIGTKILL